uniref:RNA-binding protein 41 n=1 Tax=Phasianus colchicus TaxID=9054 RepID=A0A669PV57_PHACC
MLCEGRRKRGASVLRSCETQRCRTAFNNNALSTPCAHCAQPSPPPGGARPPPPRRPSRGCCWELESRADGGSGERRGHAEVSGAPGGGGGEEAACARQCAERRSVRRRVSSSVCSDEVLLEELETEGERQLKSLLQQQLDTSASIERCKSKRRCFAPAAFYRPFGEAAAGALSLSQFRELQESDKETAALRELGLSEPEIALWKNRAAGKHTGLGAAPEAVQERLNAIQEKMEERQRILELPQRFAGSKQLSRREMEIENALFQGTDRHSFLRALYHQDEKDPMVHLESVYQEVLGKQLPGEVQPTTSAACSLPAPALQGSDTEESSPPDQEEQPGQEGSPSPPPAKPHQSPSGPVTIKEPVEFIPEDEICKNRLSEEELRNIPRFSSYNPGEPNKVLYVKNLGPRVTMKDLVSLFARFQQEDSRPIQFRLLSGRMRGQAFITFPDIQSAQDAMLLVNGYRLQGKPMVIEFGKSKGPSTEAEAAAPSSAGAVPTAT